MQLKKEIALLYILILVSAGVIVAAEKPEKKAAGKPAVKCCTIPKPAPSATPLNTITPGPFPYKA